MKLCVAIVTLIGLCVQSHAQVAPLRIPAAGIVDLEEFTIEMWVMLGFDPADQIDQPSQTNRGYIYQLNYADPAFPSDCLHSFLFTQYVPRDKVVQIITYNQVWAQGERLMFSRMCGFPNDSKPYSWHHFATTYKGVDRHFFIDGQNGGVDSLSGAFAHVLRGGSELLLGNDGRGAIGYFALDEIRVSSVARSRESLGFSATKPFEPDRFTTLIIHFDEPTFAASARAAAAAPATTQPAGTRIVEGRFGKALAFFPESKPLAK